MRSFTSICRLNSRGNFGVNSSIVVYLQEKRRAKCSPLFYGDTDSHASDVGHWLGMTPLRGVRADRVVRPYGGTQGGCDRDGRRGAPQGYLFRCAPQRGYPALRTAYRKSMRHTSGRMWASAPTEGLSKCGGKTAGGAEPLPYGKSMHFLHYCVTRRTLPKYHAPRPSFTAPATPSRI